MTRVAHWLITAIVAGAILMALEMAAFRLYAPYFGASIYVSGTTIGIVMGALAAGYAIGGRLADGRRAGSLLFELILSGASWQLLMLFTMRFVLNALAEWSDVAGVTLATLIIFAPPMIALAAAGPILVRLCADHARVGWAAGSVYALSTTGGIAGILVTIFGLLPTVGTETTLRLICGCSFVLGGSGFMQVKGGARILTVALAVVPLPSLLFVPGFGWSDGSVWTTESAYNLVRVVRFGSQWMLQLNQPAGIQTVREEGSVWTGYYYDQFALGPLLVPLAAPPRVLILGMGAGASIHTLRATAPDATIDAVEIDPKVVEAAIRWFHIDASDARLHIHTADARRWLLRNPDRYDVVQLDVYQGGPHIPFYLVTEECFRLVRGHMNDDGVLMMNVFDDSGSRQLLFAAAATLQRVFPSVMVESRGANSILFAFTRERSPQDIRRRLESRELPAALRGVTIDRIVPPAGARVLTDDLAPVEQLTR